MGKGKKKTQYGRDAPVKRTDNASGSAVALTAPEA